MEEEAEAQERSNNLSSCNSWTEPLLLLICTTNLQDVEFVLHLSGGCLCKLCDGNALTDDAGGGDLAPPGGGAVGPSKHDSIPAAQNAAHTFLMFGDKLFHGGCPLTDGVG